VSERSTSRALDADGWPHIKRTGESAGARCTESNRIESLPSSFHCKVEVPFSDLL